MQPECSLRSAEQRPETSFLPAHSLELRLKSDKFKRKLVQFSHVQPVNRKGNQSWIFTGRTDAEAEALIIWLSDAKNWLIKKDTDAGKDWRQEDKGMTEDELVVWHLKLDGHEFEETLGVMDREA